MWILVYWDIIASVLRENYLICINVLNYINTFGMVRDKMGTRQSKFVPILSPLWGGENMRDGTFYPPFFVFFFFSTFV